MGATESPPDVFSVTSFILLVLSGLGFDLPQADYEMEVEVEVGRAAQRCDGVGGAAMVVLMHLRGPAMLLPRLRRAKLGGRHAVMRYDREGVRSPFLKMSLLSFFPDQE
jgi:hypothetical protein